MSRKSINITLAPAWDIIGMPINGKFWKSLEWIVNDTDVLSLIDNLSSAGIMEGYR